MTLAHWRRPVNPGPFLFIPFLFALVLLVTVSWVVIPSGTAQAEGIDGYVLRYLNAAEPVSLPLNSAGDRREFSPEDLTRGKHLFEENCKNCHVGGATLPNPLISLSLKDLKGATPPRDTIASLVAYQRLPMSYDGTEESYWCREVPETWLTTAQLEDLAAFILRAAEKAPGWGIETFQDSAPQ